MDQSVKDSKRERTEQENSPREETQECREEGVPILRERSWQSHAESAFTGRILLMGGFTHLRRKRPGVRRIE